MYYLVTAASAIPLGRLGDKFGYLHVMIALTAASCVFYLAQFFMKQFIPFLIFRALIGFTVSGVISNRNTMNRMLPPAD